jgi:glucose-6-phosphate 1-dehydrogenase
MMEATASRPHPVPRRGEPCVLVLFGAAGDLSKRKLVPALANLARDGYLPQNFALLGVARTEFTDQTYRDKVAEDLKQFGGQELPLDLVSWFLQRCHYQQGNFEDEALYPRLAVRLAELDRQYGCGGNALNYLAVVPTLFLPIISRLDSSGLARQEGKSWKRVVIEKPFGRDLESAKALNREVGKHLAENQIYRIDHYLGKETVRNILALRFGNGIFEPIWNRRYVDHVQISVAEDLGVEQRGPYYETAGALRDMVPNHLSQLLSLTAMEPPISFDANAVRDEKAKLLHAVQPMAPEEVLRRTVRGQYGPGTVDGKAVAGYRQEERVDPRSGVETYAALELRIDNWRWAGVPFYLRTGKRLPLRASEICVYFKQPPLLLFRETDVQSLPPNRLMLRIQPEENVTLSFSAKVPGPQVRLEEVAMDFNYKQAFGQAPSTGYETLLYDCMIGDQTQYQRADLVEAGWSMIQPILDVWKALQPRDFPNYAAGSWGPAEATDLLGRKGRAWRDLSE